MSKPVPIVPWDPRTERAVIATALFGEHYDRRTAAAHCDPGFFYDPRLRVFAEILGALGDGPDPLGVISQASDRGVTDAEDVFRELCDDVELISNIEQHTLRLCDLASKRALLDVARDTQRQCQDPELQAMDVISSLRSKLQEVEATSTQQRSVIHICEAARLAFDELERGEDRSGFPPWSRALRDFVARYEPGELVIVGARTSRGKSSLCLNEASHAASIGRSVLMFSLEMRATELALREIANRTNTAFHAVRAPGNKDAFRNAQYALGSCDIRICDGQGVTVEAARSIALREHARRPLHLLIVDYLQLVSASQGAVREQQVAHVSRSLKNLAREIGCTVIAPSQLNRVAENETPALHHMRESGSIEQDADVVLLLHRPNEDHKEQMQLIVAKNRNGPTGTVSVVWNAPLVRFEDA